MQTEEREVLFAAIVFNWRRENSYPWIARKTKFGIGIEIEQNNGTLSSLTIPLFLENLCSFAVIHRIQFEKVIWLSIQT
jgi:hypothetical protein